MRSDLHDVLPFWNETENRQKNATGKRFLYI